MKMYSVYILASKSRVLYVGVTNNLLQRVFQHKTKQNIGFSSKYNVTRLVYFEETTDILSAIAREKEIKKWRREKKIALIEGFNPGWDDLSEGAFDSEVEVEISRSALHPSPPWLCLGGRWVSPPSK